MTISRVSITKIITDVEEGGGVAGKRNFQGQLMFYILFEGVVAQMCVFFVIHWNVHLRSVHFPIHEFYLQFKNSCKGSD